jgi:hypothetical protein
LLLEVRLNVPNFWKTMLDFVFLTTPASAGEAKRNAARE